VLAGPTPIERTNTRVVRNPLQGQEERGEGMRRDLYAMDVDREKNCYSYGGFSHISRNCRNWDFVG